jgi:hypothetical protein
LTGDATWEEHLDALGDQAPAPTNQTCEVEAVHVV